jgi:phosphatidylglycerophosphate synthase
MSAVSVHRKIEPQTFAVAARVQQSFVAAGEKRILIWMAERAPAGIHSDHLTVLGFVAQCSTGVCYAVARRHPQALLWGILCLVLNWLGDSLDGTLARIRDCQRPRYGFYVDHIADSVAALCLMGGLALSGYIHPSIAIGLLIGFLMLSIETYLATYTVGKFHLSHWKFGPTELRLLLAAGSVAVFHNPAVTVFGTDWRLFDFGGAIGIGGMGMMFLVAAARHISQLYKEEPILASAPGTSRTPLRASGSGISQLQHK